MSKMLIFLANYCIIFLRGRAVVARLAHNQKVVGSNPTPATFFCQKNVARLARSYCSGPQLSFLINFLMYSTYILYSEKDKRTYVGYSKNLDVRLLLHNSGQVKSTKYRRPLRLLYCEKFKTEKEAKERERWWKSSGGRKELKMLLIF